MHRSHGLSGKVKDLFKGMIGPLGLRWFYDSSENYQNAVIIFGTYVIFTKAFKIKLFGADLGEAKR